MALELKAGQSMRDGRLRNAISAIFNFSPEEYTHKLDQRPGEGPSGLPRVLEPIDSRVAPSPLPADTCVVAVDGSHVDVSRHLPARCFLINTGVSVLTYGATPEADLFSQPRLYASEEELVIRDETGNMVQSIEGAVLSAKRAVEEIEALADVVSRLPSETPTVALLDGSLILLGLVGRGYHDFVLKELIEEGFVAALEKLRVLARDRPLAVASYVSLPNYSEVVSALRMTACAYDDPGQTFRCGLVGNGRPPCDSCVGGVLDRQVFAALLEPGERSALFSASSRIIDNHYMGHGVDFFYVNAGEEVGRVDVPSWVAEDEGSLALVHSAIVDQCARGRGYPVALMEAHEQAAVTTSDRRYFADLVERALYEERMPVYTSEKARSKRMRWL